MRDNQKMAFYFFFGSPGAGKGTLARRCVTDLGWLQLSTGDLFRKHIAERTELGLKISHVIKSGGLVDDTLVLKVVEEWLNEKVKKETPIIFDGFPRTLKQAELFLALLSEKFPTIPVEIVELCLSDDEVVKRLLSRRVCENKACQMVYSLTTRPPKNDALCDECGAHVVQRVDDNEESIKNRLVVYHKHSQPLLDFYASKGIIKREINASVSMDSVFEMFEKMVGVAE